MSADQNIQRSQAHNQPNHDERNNLLQLQRPEQLAVLLHPVRRHEPRPRRLFDLVTDHVGLVQIIDAERNDRDQVRLAEQMLRVHQPDEPEARIILIKPGVKNPHHTKPLVARNDPVRRQIALRTRDRRPHRSSRQSNPPGRCRSRSVASALRKRPRYSHFHRVAPRCPGRCCSSMSETVFSSEGIIPLSIAPPARAPVARDQDRFIEAGRRRHDMRQLLQPIRAAVASLGCRRSWRPIRSTCDVELRAARSCRSRRVPLVMASAKISDAHPHRHARNRDPRNDPDHRLAPLGPQIPRRNKKFEPHALARSR